MEAEDDATPQVDVIELRLRYEQLQEAHADLKEKHGHTSERLNEVQALFRAAQEENSQLQARAAADEKRANSLADANKMEQKLNTGYRKKLSEVRRDLKSMTANFEEERKKREQVEAHVGEVTQVLQAERAQRLLDMHRLAEQTKEMQRVMTEARELPGKLEEANSQLTMLRAALLRERRNFEVETQTAQAAEEACDQLRRALGASKQREATLRQKLSTLRANSLEARVQRLRRRIKVPEAEEAEEVPLTGATALSSAPRSKRRQSEASLMSAQQGASESTARRKQRSLASGSVTSASQPVGTPAAPSSPSRASVTTGRSSPTAHGQADTTADVQAELARSGAGFVAVAPSLEGSGSLRSTFASRARSIGRPAGQVVAAVETLLVGAEEQLAQAQRSAGELEAASKRVQEELEVLQDQQQQQELKSAQLRQQQASVRALRKTELNDVVAQRQLWRRGAELHAARLARLRGIAKDPYRLPEHVRAARLGAQAAATRIQAGVRSWLCRRRQARELRRAEHEARSKISQLEADIRQLEGRLSDSDGLMAAAARRVAEAQDRLAQQRSALQAQQELVRALTRQRERLSRALLEAREEEVKALLEDQRLAVAARGAHSEAARALRAAHAEVLHRNALTAPATVPGPGLVLPAPQDPSAALLRVAHQFWAEQGQEKPASVMHAAASAEQHASRARRAASPTRTMAHDTSVKSLYVGSGLGMRKDAPSPAPTLTGSVKHLLDQVRAGRLRTLSRPGPPASAPSKR